MNQAEIIIEPGRGLKHFWLDLWRYRELFYFLAWRDILVRYKQTVIGIAWSVIRPLLTMLIFTLIFGKLARLPSGGVPYPILVFAAMLPWQFFANSVTDASNSLISNSNLITKIYFPRMILPASTIIVSLVDFLISFVLMILLMVWYQQFPSLEFLSLPFGILLIFAVSMGMGSWLAALNVKYRDFRYVVPFIVQLGLYISPVGFSSEIIPHPWRLLFSLNPMVGVIDVFRWAVLNQSTEFYWQGFLVSCVVIFALLASGLWYFRKTERTFADII